MRSLLIYCDYRKFLQFSAAETKDLKKRLAVSEAWVARLQDLLEDQDAKLLVVWVNSNLRLMRQICN
jgi:hypothetical protein